MKKTFWTISCMIAILICLIAFANVVVSATELSASMSESSTEIEGAAEWSDSVTAEVIDAEKGFDFYAFYMRLWEFAKENKTDLISMACSAILAFFTLCAKRSADKKSSAISQDLQIVKRDASGTHASQGPLIGAVNNMIDGYNGMREAYEKYESVEDDRNKLIGAVFIQNTAILEILTTVYVNSKNMPQGVKDLVNLKYANCLKALESDESLRAVVEDVRKELITANAEIAETEAPEAAEGSTVETEG